MYSEYSIAAWGCILPLVCLKVYGWRAAKAVEKKEVFQRFIFLIIHFYNIFYPLFQPLFRERNLYLFRLLDNWQVESDHYDVSLCSVVAIHSAVRNKLRFEVEVAADTSTDSKVSAKSLLD